MPYYEVHKDDVWILGALLKEPEAEIEQHLKDAKFSGHLLPDAIASLRRLSEDPLIGGSPSETRARQARALRGIARLEENHPELAPKPAAAIHAAAPTEPVAKPALPPVSPGTKHG